MVFLANADAQTLSRWQVHQGEGAINLKPGVKSRNNGIKLPVVYEYASVPDMNASQWKTIDLKNGLIDYGSSSSSILKKENYDKFTEIDITYFRAFLDLRNVKTKPGSVKVTIGNVDDQARMLIYNTDNTDGTPALGNDGKRGGKDFTTDFTNFVKIGEINTFIILQVDDNCCGNILTGGIKVMVDDKVLPTQESWLIDNDKFIKSKKTYADENPTAINSEEFNVNAFSVSQGTSPGSWFLGYNNNDKAIAMIVKANDPNSTILKIDKIPVGSSNNYAFKIIDYAPDPTNKGRSAFLVAQTNGSVTIDYLEDPMTAKNAQFISLKAFTKASGSEQFLSFESALKDSKETKLYLRHQGYKLFIHKQDPSELFKQDASWKIIKIK